MKKQHFGPIDVESCEVLSEERFYECRATSLDDMTRYEHRRLDLEHTTTSGRDEAEDAKRARSVKLSDHLRDGHLAVSRGSSTSAWRAKKAAVGHRLSR